MAFLAFIVSCLVKKDKQPDQDSKSWSTFMNKGKSGKKRKMSETEKSDKDEDVQRSIMIRKSLASRTSTRTMMESCSGMAPEEQVDTDDSEEEVEERNSASLKSDWKAYEADLQRNRSVLIRRHPGIDRSAGCSSSTPLSPLSSSPTTPLTPMTPTTPMTPLTPMTTASLSPATSPQAIPVSRQHAFPIITRKPVPPSTKINTGLVTPGATRVAAQA